MSEKMSDELTIDRPMTGPVLRHFSAKPLTLDAITVKRQANPEPMSYFTKPVGLWVSDERGDDGWRSWCASESYGDLSKQVEHEVVLHPDANIVRLTSADEIDRFTEEWGIAADREYFRDTRAIQWGSVAKRFDGILITPYIWSRRMETHTSWYYGWDCASGCIWNPRAISSLAALVSEPSQS